MLRVSRFGALAAPLMLGALLVSAAGAAEWHTNGHQTFSTTNAGASRLAVHGPTGPVLFECSSTTGVGTLRTTIAGTTAPGIARFTPLFGGPCTVAGVPGFNAVCTTADVNALSYSGGTTFATAGGGVTVASMTNIDCVVSAAAIPCSTVAGSVNVDYINPATLNSATSAGSLTVTGVNQRLEVTKIGAGCAALPNGTGTFGRPGTGSTVTDITYTVDGPNAPWMFRTP